MCPRTRARTHACGARTSPGMDGQDPEHSAFYANHVAHVDAEEDDCYFTDIDMLARVCPGDPDFEN
jgi:hypothetical protein